jgi:hypothetical protein
MERSNKNKSNKFRSKGSPAIFERVNAAKDVEKKLIDRELVYDAIDVIRNPGLTITELKLIVNNIPDNLGVAKPSLDWDAKAIRLALINIAEKYPKVIINAGPNVRMKAKAQFMDAEDARILEFSEDRIWFLENTAGELVTLCDVPVGEDKYEFLTNFWNDRANKASYQMMKRKLDDLNK